MIKFPVFIIRKILFIFCVFGGINSYSQIDSMYFTKGFLDSINIDDLLKMAEKKSYFKFQTSYLTNSVYAGRKDSLSLPYITPSVEYNHKSGFYIGASLSYLANSSSRIDLWSLDAGYTFDTIGKFSNSIYLYKSFYNSNSGNVQSDVTFSSGFATTYNNKIANITLNGNCMFGTKTDFTLLLSADHSFEFGDEEKYSLAISPSITTYFGSSGYYLNYRYKIRKPSSGGGVPQNVSVTISSPNTFQMMSLELAIPITYDKAKWGLFITPTYSIAVNPITTTIKATGPNGGNIILPNLNIPRTETEKISNTFFAEFGVYMRF